MFKSTDKDGRIFRDELYLTPQYTPDQPVGRENEVRRIAETVEKVKHQKSFEAFLVYGAAGLGKTTCIDHVLNQYTGRRRFKQVKINCWQYNTRSALLTELLIQLGYPAPRKGKPVDELLSKLQEWLNKNRDIILWLDEFDQLNDKTEIAYDLYMTSHRAKYSIGVIMVSNQPPEQLELESRSDSRLNYTTLEIKPYTKNELVEILRDRVKRAFRSGTVPDETLDLIASHTAEMGGDCRRAFDLLLRAGQRAEEEQVKEVTPRMVEMEFDEEPGM